MALPRRLVIQSEWNPRSGFFRVKLACGHWTHARAVTGGRVPRSCGCFACGAKREAW